MEKFFKKTNKHRLTFFVSVFFLAVFASAFFVFSPIFDEQVLGVDSIGKAFVDASKNNAEDGRPCETKIYQTEAQINVWYEEVDGEKFLRVADDDLIMLPNYHSSEEFKKKYSRLKLVDADKKLKNKLKNATERKPKSIIIHGYATRCIGFPLVSIVYEDGVFDRFLAIR